MVPVLVILCVLSRAIYAALRVFGGRDVDPKEYPYVVRLEIKLVVNDLDAHFQHFVHHCTASVLTPVWTLTAGHCITFEETTSSLQAIMPAITIKYVIRYGSTTAYRSATDSFSDVIGTVKHPAYKKLSTKFGDTVANDVGLLKTMPIILEQYGKLSAVEYPSLVGQAALAVGYGLMQEKNRVDTTLNLGKTLQVLDVLIKTCMKDIARGTLSPIICISRKCREPAAICSGDSGGPLIHKSGVVGVNQLGVVPDCTLQNAKAGVSSNLVGIITPISPFVAWIADEIKENRKISFVRTNAT